MITQPYKIYGMQQKQFLRGKFTAIQALLKKQEKSQINNLTYHLKELVREFGIDMYILLCLRWITNRDLLYNTGNSAQYFVMT